MIIFNASVRRIDNRIDAPKAMTQVTFPLSKRIFPGNCPKFTPSRESKYKMPPDNRKTAPRINNNFAICIIN
jgi:hypothetical protein